MNVSQSVVVVALSLLTAASVAGQQISGFIFDAQSNKPVKQAKVTSAHGKAPVYSTDSGKFVLDLTPDGSRQTAITIRVEKGGYDVATELVQIPQNLPLQLNLQPSPQPAAKAAKPAPPPKPKAPAAVSATSTFEQELASNDASRREAALTALAAMGTQAMPAVPSIVTALRDSNSAVRVRAATLLGQLKPKSSAVGDALLLALSQRSDPALQCAAAGALAAYGSSPVTIAALKGVTVEGQPNAQWCAAIHLIQLTGAASDDVRRVVGAALVAQDETARAAAHRAITRDPRYTRLFVEELAAAVALWPSDAELVHTAFKAVAALDESVRGAFTETLSKRSIQTMVTIAGKFASVTPNHPLHALIRQRIVLTEQPPCEDAGAFPQLVANAARLGTVTPAEAAAVLTTTVQRAAIEACRQAEGYYGALKALGSDAAGALREALAEQNRRDHLRIAAVLFVVSGGKAREATDLVVPAAQNESSSGYKVAIEAMSAVDGLEDERAIRALLRAMELGMTAAAKLRTAKGLEAERAAAFGRILRNTRREEVIRRAAVANLLGLPQLSRQSHDDLVYAVLNDGEEPRYSWTDDAQDDAQAALVKIGSPAVPAIVDALAKSPDSEILLKILADMKADAESAVPFLRTILPVKSVLVMNVLRAIGPGAASAVPELLSLLKAAKYNYFRITIIQTLGRFGPAAAAALPVLEALRNDPDSEVRAAVAEAILRITPAAG